VYLNVFDRYVRHELKASAYIRYGDDFLVFAKDEATCRRFEATGKQWLGETLKLKVHPTNDVIFQAHTGAKFLGHEVYDNSSVVNQAMQDKVTKQIDRTNIASYQAMHLPNTLRKQLPWLCCYE
jgi:hypothetical protein